jgi:peroxiredoxin family protein
VTITTVQVRKMDELRQVLKEAAVKEEICTYMTDVLRMTSIEDFVRFVSEAACETELLSHILIKVASFKTDLLQLSRLRRPGS